MSAAINVILAGLSPMGSSTNLLDSIITHDELVSQEYRLEEINEAFESMMTGSVARGVIVF